MNEVLRGDAAGGPRSGRPTPPYPYPYPAPAPYERDRWPTWRILDTVATIAFLAVYAFGLAALLYFSIFWVMATDSCGANDCDYDRLGTAYVLNDLVGGVVYLVVLVVAVILMVRRKPAFWLPLVGVAVQLALFLAAMQQLGGIIST